LVIRPDGDLLYFLSYFFHSFPFFLFFFCFASLFSSFFFFMFRPPPSSTLFPYTTLFRSVQRLRAQPDQFFAQRSHRLDPARHRRDRKSTRLNSSHVSISYAVFCLKKKTKKK